MGRKTSLTQKKGEPEFRFALNIAITSLVVLQLAVTHGSGEGDGIPDVADAGQIHDAALEAQAEAGMTGGAVLAQVQVEVVVLGIHTQLFDAGLQNLVVVLTLAAAGDLANTGHQAVHSGNGLAVGVQLHVEGLDVLGVVGDEDGLLKDDFGQIPLVLGLQVAAPADGVLELVVVILQQSNGIGVGDAAEVVVQNVVQTVQQTLIHKLVEEGHFLGSMLQNIGNDVLQHVLFHPEQIVQIGEGHLGLDHPELGGMAGGVGVFGTEGGAEGIDVAEGHGIGLAVELAGNGQIGGFAEEVLAEVHLAVLGQGNVLQIHGGDLEHFACALAVRAGDQGSVDIDEIPLLEELVDGHGCQAADTEHGLEGVGTGPQVRNGAQELHGVLLGLQGIIAAGGAFHGDGSGLDLKGLLGIGGQNQGALDDEGSAHVDLGDFLEILDGVVINHLNGGEVSTVVQNDEAKLRGRALVADPAADLDFLIDVFFSVLEELANGDQFHKSNPLLLGKYKIV